MLRFICLLALVAAPALAARLPYIVNGRDVDSPGKFAYQASFQFFGSHSCGAAIISANYLLSAAHCIFGFAETVVVGAHDIKTLSQGQPTTYAVQWAITHPNYGQGTGLNEADISIVKLSSAIDMTNPYVATIDLPNETDGDMAGANCVITGWGNTQIGSTGSPNILQEAATNPITLAACKAAIDAHPQLDESYVVASHICIGAKGSGFAGSCHGDSGGPLACSVGGKTVLGGVTSWGSPDCDPQWPTMYTRITSFRGWIRDNTGI